MSANNQGIFSVTGRAHCQRQVAFLQNCNFFTILLSNETSMKKKSLNCLFLVENGHFYRSIYSFITQQNFEKVAIPDKIFSCWKLSYMQFCIRSMSCHVFHLCKIFMVLFSMFSASRYFTFIHSISWATVGWFLEWQNFEKVAIPDKIFSCWKLSYMQFCIRSMSCHVFHLCKIFMVLFSMFSASRYFTFIHSISWATVGWFLEWRIFHKGFFCSRSVG